MRIRNKPGRRAKKMEQERLNRIERQREVNEKHPLPFEHLEQFRREAEQVADQLAADIEADQVAVPPKEREPDWAEACEGLEALQDSLEK